MKIGKKHNKIIDHKNFTILKLYKEVISPAYISEDFDFALKFLKIL